MRAALLPLLVGVVTLSRTNRAERLAIWSKVRLDRMPLLLTTVVKLVPSVLVWMVYSPVFQPVFSPPRPACLMTKLDTFIAEPRSTCSVNGAVSEHHLLLLASVPSTALSLISVLAHGADEVVGLPSARLVPRFGAAGGGVNPSLNDGGTSLVPVPHDHGEVAPRSSLPGRPPAEVLKPCDCTLCTASAVPAGAPAKLYAHGTPCSGSLPM